MRGKAVIKEGLKSLGALLVIFSIFEALLRVVYPIRNSTVDYVPLPYMSAGDYEPSPPWLDHRRLIKSAPDDP